MQLTTTEYAVLGLLGFGEASGYELARGAERSVGRMWAPSRSQIYKVLPRLVSLGCATGREVEQRSRPDKAIYRITKHGRAVLREWIEQIDEEPPGGAGFFVMKIFFGWAAPPEATLRQLDTYRAWLERNRDAYEEMERNLRPGAPPHTRLALRHGIARTRATLAWAEEARRTLQRGGKATRAAR